MYGYSIVFTIHKVDIATFLTFQEYFLICTFVDMDSELLKYLIDTLNVSANGIISQLLCIIACIYMIQDILEDYKVTFEENQV